MREEFQRLIPIDSGGRLQELLASIRQRLVYDEKANPCGLPVRLLADLPHPLIDVLLLLEAHRQLPAEPPHFLPAFVRDWLRCIDDSENAANIIFRRFCQKAAGLTVTGITTGQTPAQLRQADPIAQTFADVRRLLL